MSGWTCASRIGNSPRHLSTDHDPLFEAHRWTANLRILEIDGIKTVPNVPLSRPFVERLIGTMRREFLDQVLFWNARDLERKLAEFQAYYNTARSHASLEGLQRWIEHGTEDFRTVVTERSNAATEERLKSGHAVGGVSIV